MWERIDIPNEPAMLVAVCCVRSMKMVFGPKRGETIEVPYRFVGASAREVSAEIGEVASKGHPVVWRFLRGDRCGRDDPASEPPWNELRVEVPGASEDARAAIEKDAFRSHEKFEWHLFRA